MISIYNNSAFMKATIRSALKYLHVLATNYQQTPESHEVTITQFWTRTTRILIRYFLNLHTHTFITNSITPDILKPTPTK